MTGKIKFIISLLFIELTSNIALGGTTFTITPDSTVLTPLVVFDKETTENDFARLANNFFRLNSETIATGMAMTNTLGYPNGKSIIGKFPHFEVGVSTGAGIYKYTRIDDINKDKLEENPVCPGAGINGGFHFGTGVTDRIDITAKFFSLGWFYNDEKKFDKSDDTQTYNVKITDTSFNSFGVKARYNLVKSRGPFLLKFGGVSLNMGLDYMYSRIGTDINYSKTVEDIQFTVEDPLTENEIAASTGLISNVNGNGEIKTNIITLTPEALAYFDLLYVFSFYTGPSVSLNAGSVDVNLDSTGNLKNIDPLSFDTSMGNISVPADQQIGTASLRSRNSMHPDWIIPKWTIGLELNILAFKIQVEAVSILTSLKESFMAQAGIRMQF